MKTKKRNKQNKNCMCPTNEAVNDLKCPFHQCENDDGMECYGFAT